MVCKDSHQTWWQWLLQEGRWNGAVESERSTYEQPESFPIEMYSNITCVVFKHNKILNTK